jgi:primosomal protein N'
LARLRGEHRIQILIKSRSRPRLREVIDIAFAEAASRGSDLRSINLEIDPINLM